MHGEQGGLSILSSIEYQDLYTKLQTSLERQKCEMK